MLEINGRKIHIAPGTTLSIDNNGNNDWTVLAYGNGGGEPLIGVGSSFVSALDCLMDIARGIVYAEKA